MANAEHLAILEKGVEAWNDWREKNPNVQPDLSDAKLIRAHLSEANLSRAYLSGADLGGADLSRAYLSWAHLGWAHLRWAHLGWAHLSSANLCGADLGGADLRGADLFKANLHGADLGSAKLVQANVERADVRGGQLSRCNLTRAKLTGAKLYATARDDWIIEGVECRYVFWDVNGEIRSPQERDLAPGEFERLYRTLPTIEYIFQDGMTPMDRLIMDRVVQVIREQNPQYDIQIDSINARGLAPSVRFTVQQEEHKEPALVEVTRIYEAKLHELAGRLDESRSFIRQLIDRPHSVHITGARGEYLAIGGSTINIDQHVKYITNLRDAVAAQPEDSETFAKVAKKTALDIIGSALKDVAKGQVKKAAEQIIELGENLGPVILNTAAYAFFKNCVGQ